MSKLLGALIIAVACIASEPLLAGTPYAVEMKCPIGGEKFTHIETASYSTWGARPDGKPFGSWDFPLAMPVCPSNGLVIFKDFSKDELPKLKTLIQAPEYLSMAERDTPYYRVAWLLKRLEPDTNTDWVLLQASWEAEGNSELRARYQREFVKSVLGGAPQPSSLDWIAMQARTANALRELGRFDEAKALLDHLPIASLDVSIPDERIEAIEGNLGKRVSNTDDIEEAKSKRSWLAYIRALDAVIARRDAHPEPLDMIPLRVAAGRCAEGSAALADPARVCASEPIVQAIAREREFEEKLRASRPN